MSAADYNVLLVEDDEDHAVLMEKQLSRIALVSRVIRAVDGDEAIELLSDATFQPDLVLLDLNLPRFSGHEVLETMRSTKRDTPVVVVTSSSNDDDAVRALEHDVMDVVVKPASGERIAEIIHRTIVGSGKSKREEAE